MKNYTNDTGKSSISHYEIGEDFIRIQFKNGLFEYDNLTHSKIHVDMMKTLALDGKGLSRYITKYVSKGKLVKANETSKFQSLKAMFSMLLFLK